MRRAKTYDKQTGTFLAKIAECVPTLTSQEMQHWIENPGGLQEKLETALCLTQFLPSGPMNIIWKSVELKQEPIVAADMRASLQASSCELSEAADELLATATHGLNPNGGRLNIMRLSLADLGFRFKAPYPDVCRRGVELGLRLCPGYLGPYLRLQYLDQPKGEWLYIATSEAGRMHQERGFTVAHTKDGLCLYSHGGIRGLRYALTDKFVFIAPG